MLGFLALILILAIIAAVVYFVFLRKVPLSLVAKALKLNMDIQNQTGLFCFDRLSLSNSVLSLVLGKSVFDVSLYQLLTGARKRNGVFLDVDSVDIDVTGDIKKFYEKPDQEEKPKTVSPAESLRARVIGLVVFFFLRKVVLRVRNVKIKLPNELSLSTSIELKYSRKEEAKVTFKIGDSELKRGDLSYKFSEFSLCLSASLQVISSFLAASKFILLIYTAIRKFVFKTEKRTLSIMPIELETVFNSGTVRLKTTRFDFTINMDLPLSEVSIYDLMVDVAYPVDPLPDAVKMRNLYCGLRELNVSLISERFLNVQRLNVILEDFRQPDLFDVSVDTVELNYTSLDGKNLFQIVKPLRGPWKGESRPVLAFPNGHAKINTLQVQLTMTDIAVIRAETNSVTLEDRCVNLPQVRVWFRQSHIGTITGFRLSSPDQTFLTFEALKLEVVDDHTIVFNEFIENIIYGWKIIKPLVSRGIFDSETLPLPFHIIVKKAAVNIDDTNVNRKLVQLAKVMPAFLKDKVVLQHILTHKVQQLNFGEKDKAKAQEQLDKLVMSNYRKMYSQLKFHTWSYYLRVYDIDVKLDSRDVVNKQNIIWKLSPATAERYPNPHWDTLEGLRISGTIRSLALRSIDLQHPMFEAKNVTGNALLIIGEISDGNCIYRKATVCGETFDIDRTLTPCKLYSDVKIELDYFKWYLGGAYMRILDGFSDVISGFIPVSEDPSPEMKWWDKIRSMFWGRYEVKAKEILSNFVGGTSHYNQDDQILADAKTVHGVLGDGLWDISVEVLNLYRKENGPLLGHFPALTLIVSFIWDTPCGDQRQHIFFPDMSRLEEPGYDTYDQFRATGLAATFKMIMKRDNLTPCVEADFAHLRWLFDPLVNLFLSPVINEPNTVKYGIVMPKPPPKFLRLSDLKTSWKLVILDTPTVSARLFDHFPVENSKFFCSSVDITLVKPSISFELQKCKDDLKPIIELSAESITLNATDIPISEKFTRTGSTTFCIISNPLITYDEKLQANMAGIKLYGNQFYVQYLYEFGKAMFSVFETSSPLGVLSDDTPTASTTAPAAPPKIAARKSVNSKRTENKGLLNHLLKRGVSQRSITVEEGKMKLKERIGEGPKTEMDRYSEIFGVVQIPSIQFVFESLLVDARVYLSILDMNVTLSRCPKDGNMAAQLFMTSLCVAPNIGFDPLPSELETKLVDIQLFTAEYRQSDPGHFVDLQIEELGLKGKSGDVALIFLFKNELLKVVGLDKKPDKKKEVKEVKDVVDEAIPISFVGTINKIKAEILGVKKEPMGSMRISNVEVKMKLEKDHSSDTSALIRDLEITDGRKGKPQQVAGRWLAQSDINVASPLIRIQAKESAPVGGISVFSHVEVNIDPVVVVYDASFFNYLIGLVVDDKLLVGDYVGTRFEIPKTEYSVPKVLLPQGFLPSIDQTFDMKFHMNEKVAEYEVRASRADTNFLMRYFKITSCKLCVSYFNPDNKIVPSITEFNGRLHDVILQDFTANWKALAGALISTITRDMIPQFIKHLFGGGKLSESKEAELSMWLANDHEKAAERKKELLFGKKTKKKGK